MFLIVSELAERFIEFVLGIVKGDTIEEKLTSALKSSALLIAVLGTVSIWIGTSYFNLLIVVNDMEVGLNKVDALFDDVGTNSLSVFAVMNDKLTKEISESKNKKILLMSRVSQLNEENKWLKGRLSTTIKDNGLIKQEYKDLVSYCLSGVKKNGGGN